MCLLYSSSYVFNKFNLKHVADILVTHGPAQTHLDTSGPPYNQPNLGCELLTERIEEIKPKIHVCGHIHGGYGYKFDGQTHFFNV
jgi:Icc-related predicted phosphoesterase